MRKTLERIGVVVFFLAWPAFWLYLRRGERTRIIVANGNKVLVTKNWISDGAWSLPGGGLHKDEPVLAGAQRELREETGIRLRREQLRRVGKQEYRRYGLRFVFHVFVARNVDSSTLHRQKHEVSRLEWIDYHQLTSRNTSQDALRAIDIWLHS